MYPVSEAYKNAIAQNERNVRIIGTITLKDGTVIEIDDEDIVQGSLYVSEQCVSGEDIEIGNVYASEMGLSLNSPPENPYALDGARIVLNFGIETSEGVWEYVPLGYFYVTEIERKTNVVALKALDGMILFDTDLSGVLTTGTPYEMISSCCTKVGITLATDSATFSTFANGNMTFTLPAESNVKTCRDLIMWICQLTGTFARMNRMGQLEIVPVKGGTSVKTIDRQQRFTSDVSDSYVKITKVAMKVGDVEYSQGTDGMTMVLEENPLLAEKTEAEINTVLDEILGQVTQAEYTPCNVDFAGDPALQAGDYINLTGIKMFDKIRATFTRSTPAYLSDGTQVAANVPRFEQGKFGKAVLVEEGTTNLVSNPSFESGMWPELLNPSNGTATLVTGWNGSGNATRITITREDTAFGIVSARNMSLSEGVKYTISFRARAIRDNFPVTYMYLMSSSVGNSILPTINLGTTWQRYTITYTIPADKTASDYGLMIAIDGRHSAVYANDWIEVDDVQLEAKPYATSFIDGTRSPETLTIPTAGVLNPQEGTIEGWFYLNDTSSAHYSPLFITADVVAPGPRLLIMRDKDSGMLAGWDGDGTSESVYWGTTVIQPKTWYFFAFTWSSTGRKLYLNGVLEATSTRTTPIGMSANARIGGWGGNYLNGLIDDLRISSIARSDDEIAAAYQSGQSLPVDEYTTLKMNFDGSLTTITTVGDSIVTHSNWRYRGPHNIKAVGKSALVRGVQAQQTKSVSAVKTVAETAREIAQAANQSTQLIQDAITGYVLIRKNETTGSNEILIMDNPDPAQARKVWRWNMGGLGYSDNVVGVDNPDRVYTVAMTMDGAINANFIKTGKIAAQYITVGPETVFAPAYVRMEPTGFVVYDDQGNKRTHNGQYAPGEFGNWVDAGHYVLRDKGMDMSLMQLPNLIPDHSFECLKATGNIDTTYHDFAIAATSGNWNWFEWNKVGSPRLLSARQTGIIPEAVFGLQAVVTNSSNYVAIRVWCKPNTTYYLSGFVARGYRNSSAGTPKLYISFRKDDDTQISITSQTFTPNTGLFNWKRVGFSFTTPANCTLLYIVPYSTDSNYIYWDALQLVEGNKPVRYEPEENLWRHMFGASGVSLQGHIVESGENANGRWIRFSDGTQICWFYGSRSLSIPSAYGSLYQNSFTCTYPAPFINKPSVSIGQIQWGTGASWGMVSATNTGTVVFRIIDVRDRSTASMDISYIAIGRWK